MGKVAEKWIWIWGGGYDAPIADGPFASEDEAFEQLFAVWSAATGGSSSELRDQLDDSAYGLHVVQLKTP